LNAARTTRDHQKRGADTRARFTFRRAKNAKRTGTNAFLGNLPGGLPHRFSIVEHYWLTFSDYASWHGAGSRFAQRTRMNTTSIKGNWIAAKGKLKQKYAQLTDDDLRYEEGKEQEMLGRLIKRTGQSQEAMVKFLKDECACDFSSESNVRAWESSPKESADFGRPKSSDTSPQIRPTGGYSAPSSDR
jgi:uncharacterized protein YjbJ (UPF0337 family)